MGATVGSRRSHPRARSAVDRAGRSRLYWAGVPYEWQYTAAHVDRVPDSVLARPRIRSPSSTRASTSASGHRGKESSGLQRHPPKNRSDVRDYYATARCHSLAAGSVTNGEGIVASVATAPLRAGRGPRRLDLRRRQAAGISTPSSTEQIINLSLGGLEPSALETRAVRYAQRHPDRRSRRQRVQDGNPVEYPAALRSRARTDAAAAASVGASTQKVSAYFRTQAATSRSRRQTMSSPPFPGASDFAAIASGSNAGVYGFSTGTSFSAPGRGLRRARLGGEPGSDRTPGSGPKQPLPVGDLEPEPRLQRLDAAAAVALAPTIAPAVPAAAKLLPRAARR